MLSAALTGVLGVGTAWILARPGAPAPSAVPRVLADCLGATTLGLALLRTDLFPERSKPPVWRSMVMIAGAWSLTEIALVTEAALASYGSSIDRLPMNVFGSFLVEVTVGQLGLMSIACIAGICIFALAAFRFDAEWSTVPVVVLAVLALLARPIFGHMSQQLLGSMMVAVHTLAAAVWLGVLAAMALKLRARGAWALALAVYSRLAWWAVWILAASGTVNAAVRIGSVTALFDTGYGRIMLAKTVTLIVLVALARKLRMTWLVSAAAHRTGADESILRASIHVCTITVAFGLAAALATTA